MTSLLLFASVLQAPPVFTVGGTVIHSLTRRPLDKVRVSLAPVEQLSKAVTTVTGRDGRFRFAGVKPGKYSLSAERLGFARQSYKQRSLFQAYASGVVVGEAESTEKLVFAMIPGAAITGHVTDLNGDPVPGINVGALRVVGCGGQRRAVPFPPGGTDDRGYYRLHSLPAGTFVVVVSGKTWQEEEVVGLASEPLAYPMTFFPGTTNPERAEPVRLAAGQELRADIVLNPVPSARLHGTVAGERGKRSVYLTAPSAFGSEVTYSRQESVYGSEFTMEGIPPGRYFLNLLEGRERLIGRRAVEVVAPETEVTIGETPLAKVSVTVEIRGSRENLGAQTIVMIRQANGFGGQPRALDSDGRAVFSGLPPSRYRLAVVSKKELAVLSITARGNSQSGGVIEVPETGTVEIAVVADASSAEIAGRVFREGQTQAGLIVLLVPRHDWKNASGYRMDQSDSDGTFTWSGVAPGDYLMFAFEEGEPADYADPEAIRPLLPQGQPLTVTGASKQTARLDLPAR